MIQQKEEGTSYKYEHNLKKIIWKNPHKMIIIYHNT